MTAMIYLLFASVWKHLMQLYQDSQKLCPLQNKKSVLQAVNLFSNTVQTKLAKLTLNYVLPICTRTT